jgi:hypothetical protein
MQACKLSEAVQKVESGGSDEKPGTNPSRSLQEKSECGSQVNSQAARADRNRSTEEAEGPLRALVADESERLLKGESDVGGMMPQEARDRNRSHGERRRSERPSVPVRRGMD